MGERSFRSRFACGGVPTNPTAGCSRAHENETLLAHAATVARWWRLVRADVSIDYKLHDLRHFYACGLIATGCDVVAMQRALAHSSASVTLDTYSHLWPDANGRTR
ncbi:MAG: tyrosine-type recombinase/integrase, partial [Mycolicibacterium vanbaalenii]